MSSPRAHRAAPATALLALLILGLVATAVLAGPAFGQSAVSVQLTGGVGGGAYFSVNSGFNVVGVEVAAAAGSPVQRFTARADGDGANTVFDLTDALAVTFEGDILVSDETPTGAVDGMNRLFTPLQTMGDSGIAHDNLPDGYWAREDIVVRIDGATLPLAQYAILPDYPTGTVMVQIQTLPSPPAAGADIRFTYKTPIFDIHDPGATPISGLVSATDGVNTFAAQSIDAAAGVVTLDGAPVEGLRNVVLTFETGELGRIVGVAVSTETARSTGETRRYSVIESPAGSGRYPFNVGLVTAADLRAVRDRITAPERTVGELLGDLYVAGEGGLAARLTELRDELGLTDADAAGTLVDRLLPAADGDTLFVGYGSAGASATIDLSPPTLQALSPVEGSFVTSATAELRATATDAGAGVDLSGLGTAESAALMTVDGVVLGGDDGGLGAIAGSGGAVTFTASVPASDRVVSWSMDVGDRVGNRISAESAGAAGAPFTFIVDRTPPVMTSASTGLFYDAALRSEVGPEVGAVRIEFDGGVVAGLDGSAPGAPLDPATVSAEDFLVDGAAPLAAAARGPYVYLRTADTRTDDTPLVEVAGPVADTAGNAMPVGASIRASDATGPSVTLAVERGGQRTNRAVRVAAQASEPLGAAPRFSVENGSIVGGPFLEGDGVWSVVVAGHTDGAVVVAVEARDAAGNAMRRTGEDMSSQADGSRIAFLVSQRLAAGESGELTLAVDSDPARGPSVGPLATTLAGGVPDKPPRQMALADFEPAPRQGDIVTASYVFAATVSFTWDATPPSASLDPPAEGLPPTALTVEGPIWLRLDYGEPVTLSFLSFDDSEQTHDVYTADGRVFVLAIEHLALGTHTLRVRAVDAAGNEGEGQEFIIEAVHGPTFDLFLQPGWNLISLPARPVSPAPSALFANTTVEAVVRFDPEVGLMASTSTLGVWSGEVTELVEGEAYWVYARRFETTGVELAGSRSPLIFTTQSLRRGVNYLGVVTRDVGNAVVGVEPSPVEASDYLESIAGKWERIVRFDPDPARGFEWLTPSMDGWNGVDPAGPDDEMGLGPDGVPGTDDDVPSEKADNVPRAAPMLEPGRGYIVIMKEADDLFL